MSNYCFKVNIFDLVCQLDKTTKSEVMGFLYYYVTYDRLIKESINKRTRITALWLYASAHQSVAVYIHICPDLNNT